MEKNIKKELLGLARASLISYFDGSDVEIRDSDVKTGSFVTLKKHGTLRGCIGYISGYLPLYRQIYILSREAAFSDYRFPPVEKDELDEIRISISLLTELEAITTIDSFDISRDGIMMTLDSRRALFLPSVAKETGWDRETLLAELSRKAGLPLDAWKNKAAVFSTFQSEEFSEDEM